MYIFYLTEVTMEIRLLWHQWKIIWLSGNERKSIKNGWVVAGWGVKNCVGNLEISFTKDGMFSDFNLKFETRHTN